MSIRDGLIIVGVVILLVVAADLIRRFLQRGKLRIAIDKTFTDLPDAELNSELPNGGARVVSPGSVGASGRQADTRTAVKASAPAAPAGDQADAVAEPRREVIDDALSTAPDQVAESEAEADWVVDPSLRAGADTDETVDLLLEREFKGVGQGADLWAEPPAVEQPSADPAVVEAPLAEPPVDENVAEVAQSAVEPVTEVDDVESSPPFVEDEPVSDADPAVQAPVEVEPEASTPKQPETVAASGPEVPVEAPVEASVQAPAVALVESDIVDLERPVHELLLRQQSASSPNPGESATVVADDPSLKVQSSETALAEAAEAAAEKRATKKTVKPAAKAGRKRVEPRAEEQPSFFDLHPDLAPEVELPAAKPKSRRRMKKAKPAAPKTAPVQEQQPPEQQVLVINVQARQQPFPGAVLFKLVAACGLEFGSEMSIYHRFESEDGQGALQFSMANAIAPGTFDPATADAFSTPAITFFMQLSDPTDRMNAFECMLATAQCVADNLNGELRDENRSSLRTQTIEHYRQKVREFERIQLTRRA